MNLNIAFCPWCPNSNLIKSKTYNGGFKMVCPKCDQWFHYFKNITSTIKQELFYKINKLVTIKIIIDNNDKYNVCFEMYDPATRKIEYFELKDVSQDSLKFYTFNDAVNIIENSIFL